MRTVLFVGAGRDQRRAIMQAKALGLRVVAVDNDPDAAGLREADIAKVVDRSDAAAVLRATARLKLDGVLTVGADGAVPVVAAVAEARGLPGIDAAAAHELTHKVAMRRRLAEAGVPQPRFAAVRSLSERRRAADEVGFPAVLKPADASSQRGLFRVDTIDDVDAHLHEALSSSPSGEAMLEEYVDGAEMNAIVIARKGSPTVLMLADRLHPPAAGFGVAWAHVYPAAAYGVQLEETERIAAHAVKTLGLTTGIALAQLIGTPDGGMVFVGCTAQIPRGPLGDLIRIAVGVDLVDVQLRMALGDEVPDDALQPRLAQPAAVSFLTAEPGPLPTGRVRRVGPTDKVLAFPGIVQAEAQLRAGDLIHPVRGADDRYGYVLAVASTNLEALERAEAAARLLDVEVA